MLTFHHIAYCVCAQRVAFIRSAGYAYFSFRIHSADAIIQLGGGSIVGINNRYIDVGERPPATARAVGGATVGVRFS